MVFLATGRQRSYFAWSSLQIHETHQSPLVTVICTVSAFHSHASFPAFGQFCFLDPAGRYALVHGCSLQQFIHDLC